MSNKKVSELITECGGSDYVAEKMGVSLYTIGNWVMADAIPAKRIKDFAEKFNLDINLLVPFLK